MKLARNLTALAVFITLGACKVERAEVENTPEPVESETGEGPETVSILRPDVEAEQGEVMAAVLEPLNAVIGFPKGGSDIDAAARTSLRDVAKSKQIGLGGPIVLRAHSDSAGSDRVNADAAKARGLAVAAWLIEEGVDEDRIEVIIFGEQNPVEPNALPDGSPNEEGRAANRRVEVLIVPADAVDKAETAPTGPSAETGD